MNNENRDVERIEVELLLEALRKRYGYDFAGYSTGFFARRLKRRMELEEIDCITSFTGRILRDENLARRFVADLSINATEMFRDPSFFRLLREIVLPSLRDREVIKVWAAGCSTGEEVYSLAIVFHEEGLYERCQIYATDISEENIKKAREGIYRNETIKSYGENYYASGGKEEFSDYFLADDTYSLMRSFLKKNIVFSTHNLATDGVFAEMDLILCRNVLIYFGRSLKERVIRLFFDSLREGGFLCLGSRETLDYSPLKSCFHEMDQKWKIYRKVQECLVRRAGKDVLEERVDEAPGKPELPIVVIGASAGGIQALKTILAGIPPDFPAAVLVVLHRHRKSSHELLNVMDRGVNIELKEAHGGEKIEGGNVYLAPSDYHMMVDGNGLIGLSLEEPVNYARPSIDVLFESAAQSFGDRVIGVLLSGASRDGVEGLKRIREAGGVAIVQDPGSAISPFMPSCAIDEGAFDEILKPHEIGPFVVDRVLRVK